MMMMADEDKQFDASPTKLARAREEGQIPKSQDLGSAILMAVLLFLLLAMAPFIWQQFIQLFIGLFQDIVYGSIQGIGVQYVMVMVLKTLALTMAPFLILAMITGAVSQIVQTGFLFTTKPLTPKFDRLNPMNGFKQLFSMSKVVDLAKNIIKISLLSILAFMIFQEFMGPLVDSGRSGDVNVMLMILGDMLRKFITLVAIAFFIIGAADYLYQRFKFMKDQKMSMKEVKDEYKQQEGDPHVKQAIRERRMQMAQQRMLDAVATADVVATNPIHVAVAIQYRGGDQSAPVVVAKGTSAFARRIKEIATKNNVPVIENPLLARSLYQLVPVNQEIAPELYQAVAEVLTTACKVSGKLPPGGSTLPSA
jgi:flagellar biosynthetic protein FlhB